MATIKIDTLDYKPVSGESPAYVAQFDVQGGNVYSVDVTTAIKMSEKAVPARWLIIDNTQSGGNVLVSFNGNYRFNALPYSRDVFPLGGGINTLTLTPDVNVSTAIVSISSEKLAPETDNQFLIQQVVTQVTFPIGPAETVSRVQVAGDDRTSVLFVTTNGAPINYSLMSAAVAGIGWMQGVFNESAVGDVGDVVTFVTSGGDLVNGAAIWSLPPRSGGFLMSNGVDWYYVGVRDLMRLSGGNAGGPTYSWFGDTDTGMYSDAGGAVKFSSNGVQSGTINSFGIFAVDGSAGVPSHSFLNDTDTGMWRSGANTLAFATGGANRAILDADGFTVTNGGFSAGAPANAAYVASGSFGGAFTLIDGAGYNSIYAQSTGAQLVFAMGSISSVVTWATYSSSTQAFSLANGRLEFPATPNPSTNQNTLDTYAEFTWTPIFAATGSTFVYASQLGWGIKIGRALIYGCRIGLGVGNVFGAGGTQVQGFPHTFEATVPNQNGPAFCLFNNLAAAMVTVIATPSPGGTLWSVGAQAAAAISNGGATAANTFLNNSCFVTFNGVALAAT